MLFKKIYILFQKTYILFLKIYILFQKHMFFGIYICGKTYVFRKAPSRTRRVREGALQKTYIFLKAPSRTRRVREGALRKIYVFLHASPEGTQIHVLVSVYLFKDATLSHNCFNWSKNLRRGNRPHVISWSTFLHVRYNSTRYLRLN